MATYVADPDSMSHPTAPEIPEAESEVDQSEHEDLQPEPEIPQSEHEDLQPEPKIPQSESLVLHVLTRASQFTFKIYSLNLC